MRQVVVTTRTAKTRRPERVQALGPQTMGQPLDGSYSALHSVEWSLYWHRSRGLILEQRQGAAWVEVVPGQAFPALTRTTRHIGLAFDQAARHVVCWEDLGQALVRQWDPIGQVYVYRGPFAGVDPLLLTDTTASFYSPDSDVVLLYLNAARTAAFYRLQRDAYGVEYSLVAGLSGAVLDQVVVVPYGAQLRGESGGAGLVIDLGLYPYRLSDAAAMSGALVGGVLETMLINQGAADPVAMTGSLGGLMEYFNLTYTYTDPVAMSGSLGGQLETISLAFTVPDGVTGTGSFASGQLETVLIPYALTDPVAMTGSFEGGYYGP